MATTNASPKQEPAAPTTALAEKKPSASERFTSMVMAEYGKGSGLQHQFSSRETQIIRNYFVAIDQTLTKAEADRLRKNASNLNHKYDNALPYSWQTINLAALATDLAHYAHIGLDMLEDNHLFPIPYKDNKNNVYTITLMEGYNGIRYQAEKYALNPPRNVTVEVVYTNDVFKPIKKDARNPVEGYEFDIPNPFDRGVPFGVFGYVEFEDAVKNFLIIFSKADVMKRKPKYASAEFWGGIKKAYEDGKQVEVTLDGWLPEMFEKTMKREIYGSKRIPRDPGKVDESYQYIRQREQQYIDLITESEVEESSNKAPLSIGSDPEAEIAQEELAAAPIDPPGQAALVAAKPAIQTRVETVVDDEDIPDFLR
jgi:recombination protein RecT